MKKIPDWLILTVCRALLGEIYSSIRAVALKYEENKSILLIRYYLDRESVAWDKESLEVLATNIAATVEKRLIERIDLECQFSNASIGNLDALDGFVFCRREYNFIGLANVSSIVD